MFDTLKLADGLKAAGIKPEQAKKMARAIEDSARDSIASKADIAELRDAMTHALDRARGQRSCAGAPAPDLTVPKPTRAVTSKAH